MKYRPEIDGLRGIAVLPVFMFHANVAGFTGGFIGVDVFFVISGYLITSLIYTDIEAGHFLIAGFYERRVRRILPALSVVLLVCLVATWFVLLPNDFLLFSESLVATTLFGSNFYFKNRTGYFYADEAETSTLLHTWSLSIEEQFYIIFPLILIALFRYFPRRKGILLLTCCILSFAANMLWVKHAQESAFYLLPFRAWELLSGALLALGYSLPKRPEQNKFVHEITGFAGVALIFICIFLYNRNIEFPGLPALVPCVGAWLIIASNTNFLNTTGKLLSLKPLVFTGKISYPFYLWHWPLLVLLRYRQDNPVTAVQVLLIFVLAIVLSVLTWNYIEQPIRSRKVLAGFRPVMKTALIYYCVIASAGLTVMLFNGFPQRLPPDIVNLAEGKNDADPDTYKCFRKNNLDLVTHDRLCRLGNGSNERVEFILWGDSHADAIYPVMKALAENYHIPGVFAANPACPPLMGIDRINRVGICSGFNDAVFNYVISKNIKNVILAARWEVNMLGRMEFELREGKEQIFLRDAYSQRVSLDENVQVFNRNISDTVKRLYNNGINVWIILQAPETGINTPYYLARKSLLNKLQAEIRINLADSLARHFRVKQLFIDNLNEYDTRIIDPAEFLCVQDNCLIGLNGFSIYKDDDHLSRRGALLLKPIFAEIFRKIRPGAE